jgi:hypothetical protein
MSGDGSEKDERPSGKLHTADTVPPPASGDAYNAATEIRQAPEDLLDIMREVKEARAIKQAAKAAGGPEVLRVPKAPLVPSILGLRPPAAGTPAVAAPAPAPVVEPEPAIVVAPSAEPPAAAEPEPAPVVVALPESAPPAAMVPASVDDSPLEYPGTARRQRNRKTAVAVLSILLVVAVVLAAITVVLGLKSGAAT